MCWGRAAEPRPHGALRRGHTARSCESAEWRTARLPRPARPRDRWLTMNACSRAVRGPSSTPRGLATPARAARPAVWSGDPAPSCAAMPRHPERKSVPWLVQPVIVEACGSSNTRTSTYCDAAGHNRLDCSLWLGAASKIAEQQLSAFDLRRPQSTALVAVAGVQIAGAPKKTKTVRTRAFRRAQALLMHSASRNTTAQIDTTPKSS